jgi:H+/Cl- antiporter ClcA
VTGALAVLALLWLKTGGVTGGYDTLALEGKLAVKVLLALCLMKIAATVFCYSAVVQMDRHDTRFS